MGPEYRRLHGRWGELGGLRVRQPAVGKRHAFGAADRSGPRDNYISIHIPIGYGKTMWHPQYNWRYYTEPDPGVNHREVY